MTTRETIIASMNLLPSSDLAAVNEAVKTGEEDFGPLRSMRIENATTLLRFSAMLPEPAVKAIVAEQKDGKPVIPDGAELVTAGQIFVKGVPTLCAATRAKSAT